MLRGRAEGLKQAHSSYVDNVERERREREQRRQNDERRRREDASPSPALCSGAASLKFFATEIYSRGFNLLLTNCLDTAGVNDTTSCKSGHSRFESVGMRVWPSLR